ncbi:MAG TPA: Hsp20/alpha crystallin family protein [Gammaproteobacteria bacterium]|nr:Hsp20/alpha crystallin family protein [Gammaproteobacteria bacterium]
MNLQKLNPWNWFKHEESSGVGEQSGEQYIPVKRDFGSSGLPVNQQNPSQSILQLHQDMNRLFDEVFNSSGFPSVGLRMPSFSGSVTSVLRPKLNISSDDHNYNISLELPGLKESDISVEVKNDVLTVRGTVNEEKEDKDKHFYRIERSYGTFQRTLALPDDANADDIRASMKDGVLDLMIPRNEETASTARKIAINGED